MAAEYRGGRIIIQGMADTEGVLRIKRGLRVVLKSIDGDGAVKETDMRKLLWDEREPHDGDIVLTGGAATETGDGGDVTITCDELVIDIVRRVGRRRSTGKSTSQIPPV